MLRRRVSTSQCERYSTATVKSLSAYKTKPFQSQYSEWKCKDEITNNPIKGDVPFRSKSKLFNFQPFPKHWLPSLPNFIPQSLVKVQNLEIDKIIGIKLTARDTLEQNVLKWNIVSTITTHSGKIIGVSRNKILIFDALDKNKTWRFEKDFLLDKVDHIETDISMEIINIVMRDKISTLEIIPKESKSTAHFISMLLFTIKTYLKSNEFLNVKRLNSIGSLPSLKSYNLPRAVLFSSLATLQFFKGSVDEIDEKELIIQIGFENYRPLHLSLRKGILEFFIPPIKHNEAPKLLSVPIIEISSLWKDNSLKRNSIILTWNSITIRIAGAKSKIQHWYKLVTTGIGDSQRTMTGPTNELVGFFATKSCIVLVSLDSSKIICNSSIQNVSISQVKRLKSVFSFILSIDAAEASEENIVESLNEVKVTFPLAQYFNLYPCLKMFHIVGFGSISR